MANYDLIKDAIVNKKQVTAIYNGYTREMCPHVLGTKNGRMQCLFYQFGGGSSSGVIVPGSPQNWRCIPIETMQIIEVKIGAWYSASNHSVPQSCVDEIHVEVEI